MRTAAMTAGGTTWGGVFDAAVGGPLRFLDAFIRNAFGGDLRARETLRRTAHMRALDGIAQAIDKAMEDEARFRRMTGALERAGTLDRTGVDTMARFDFLVSYVRQSPELLSALEVEASCLGLGGHVLPVLNIAEESFARDEEEVLGPGGLLPALQDAFVAQRVLEELGYAFQCAAGGPLLDVSLALPNNYARILLELVSAGVTHALELRVEERVGRADAKRAIGALTSAAPASSGERRTLLLVSERLPRGVARVRSVPVGKAGERLA